MNRFIKFLGRYKEETISIYDGTGHKQGIGFSQRAVQCTLFGFKWIKEISIKVEVEWLETLKDKLK